MAKDEDEDRKVDEEEDEESSSDAESPADDGSKAQVRGGGELVKADSSDEGEKVSAEGEAEEEGEEDEGPQAAAYLGSDRYVMAGFFAAGMTGAYVLGRALEGLWINAANKDWFSQLVIGPLKIGPVLSAVSDNDKAAITIVIGGLIALIFVYRTYRKPEVRQWADEVAAELQKVVWPSRKDVTNSTFIVIVASTVATLYLTLLDRLWAFVTNIVYGDGS